MKRTGTPLKWRGIKEHVPNEYHAYSFYKFDRNYVASHFGDAHHVPVNRGCRRKGYEYAFENPNKKLWAYLNHFMRKHVGKKTDDVFHEFSKLGWKSTNAMFYYWEGFIDPVFDRYYTDKDGCMCFNPKSRYRKGPWYLYDWDDWDDWDDIDEDEDLNEAYLLRYARKPSSEKRLVRRRLWRGEQHKGLRKKVWTKP